MRYVIISDLHSNLEALDAFVRVTKGMKFDKLVCLGDIVGYGANPNELVDWVRDNAQIVLAGNHDYAAVELTDTAYFNPYALNSCYWTRHELTEKNRKYLASLPVDRVEDGIHWSHSSPYEPEEWHYVVSRYDGIDNFPHFEETCCFLGHTHRPCIMEEDPFQRVQMFTDTEFKLKEDCRYLFNVGSLGQPRDGSPDPAFAIYDSEAGTFQLRRFGYDFELAQKKILENGLPPFLAERLAVGL